MIEQNLPITFPNGSQAWTPNYIGKGSELREGVNIGSLCHIGRDVSIGQNTRIQGSTYIADGTTIGSNCFIGPNVTITNDKYPPSKGQWQPVTIEDNVILGGGITLIAGIHLGHGCIIGAGSVVTKSVPSKEVWYGSPASFKMTTDVYRKRREGNGA